MSAGDAGPARDALAAAYDRLRRLAARHLSGERPDHTLSPTALVHETWLRLASWGRQQAVPDRELPLLASVVMRRILTDHARRRAAARRDAARAVPLGDLPDEGAALVLAVDEALADLAAQDAELARIVELRFFGDCTVPEIAALTGLSPRSVDRRWRLARAWLLAELSDAAGPRATANGRHAPRPLRRPAGEGAVVRPPAREADDAP